MGRFRLRNVVLPGRRRPRLVLPELDLGPGLIAVVGPSGCGKTSLLDLLVGFVAASTGLIERDLPRIPGRLPLAWAPVDGGLWPGVEVRHQVAGCCPAGMADRAELLLQAFDLGSLATALPERLSAGEIARVNLARSLAGQPTTVVWDEPLAHVDPARLPLWWARALDEVRRLEATLIYATHDPDRVLGSADQVVCLHDGHLVGHGPVDDLWQRPPSPEAALALGPANWFSAGEAGNTHPCVRPEALRLVPDPAGGWEVRSSRRHGLWRHTRVQPVPEGPERLVVHRGDDAPHPCGLRVGLRMLVLLLVLVVGGCAQTGSELSITAWDTRQLPDLEGSLPAPRALCALPDGRLLVLDTVGRMLIYGPDLELRHWWRMPDYVDGRPEAVLRLADGRIAVADTHYHRVLFFDEQGRQTASWGQAGQGLGSFGFPVDLAPAPDGGLFVAEYGGNDRVQQFTSDGRCLRALGRFGTGPEDLQRPSGLLWQADQLLVADALNHRILVYASDGRCLGRLGGERAARLDSPYDLARTSDGRLVIPEYGASRLSLLGADGRLLGRIGHPGRERGGFATPWAAAVLPDGRIVVADTGNRRLVWLRVDAIAR